MRILMGFYYGIGDLVSAVPVIQEVSKRSDCQVTIAIGEQNRGLVPLLNLDDVEIIYFSLFSLRKLNRAIEFFKVIYSCHFDEVIISPHAQIGSWKIPLLLRVLKSREQKLVGSADEKMSFLYTKPIPIDKSLPLMTREIEMAKLARLIQAKKDVDVHNIFRLKKRPTKDLIVIHPGASKRLKMWEAANYRKLVDLISVHKSRVIFIGLERELEEVRSHIPNPDVLFISGSFEKVINLAMEAKAVITMDSGFGHIASALKLKHFVLVGSADPEHIRPIYDNTIVIAKNSLSCQPCEGERCKFKENYCMSIISPETVYSHMKKAKVFDS